VFKPNWARHGKAAPFKRNDQVLDVLPIGAIVFSGSGISTNLADKAKKLGIPVWKFDNGRPHMAFGANHMLSQPSRPLAARTQAPAGTP